MVLRVTRDRTGQEYRLQLARIVAMKRWDRRSQKPQR
jgi:hypothetical protein